MSGGVASRSFSSFPLSFSLPLDALSVCGETSRESGALERARLVSLVQNSLCLSPSLSFSLSFYLERNVLEYLANSRWHALSRVCVCIYMRIRGVTHTHTVCQREAFCASVYMCTCATRSLCEFPTSCYISCVKKLRVDLFLSTYIYFTWRASLCISSIFNVKHFLAIKRENSIYAKCVLAILINSKIFARYLSAIDKFIFHACETKISVFSAGCLVFDF